MTAKFFNPFKQTESVAVASANQNVETGDSELATASALSNTRIDMCPKCGVKMVEARIYNGTSVYYCDTCRVTHPTC